MMIKALDVFTLSSYRGCGLTRATSEETPSRTVLFIRVLDGVRILDGFVLRLDRSKTRSMNALKPFTPQDG